MLQVVENLLPWMRYFVNEREKSRSQGCRIVQ